MKKIKTVTGRAGFLFITTAAMIMFLALFSPSNADENIYSELSRAGREKESSLLNDLMLKEKILQWDNSAEKIFEGNLRFIERINPVKGEPEGIFLVRSLKGEIYIVSTQAGFNDAGADYHSGLEELLGYKLTFKGKTASATVNSRNYMFIRFSETPQQLLLDRIFKISIIFMFFFVMLGMGLNLTLNDFLMVIRKPSGIAVGIILQWLLMPLLAQGMAYLLGFYHSFPFIYAGLILICACPGGVTSNLMTYYANGDLALSVSLTSISTLLSLFFTPFILTFFCANIPDINIPTGLIVQTIIGLVIIPLILGMSIRMKWDNFARKATPFFSALGVFALMLVIGVGLFTNAEKFADTESYNPVFYIMVIFLSVAGMFIAALFPKFFRISNYQARAISMEVGLRNSTLAVTIALLIQDLMGDFYSSMFVTTAIYGITMYITGFLMIVSYKKLLPLDNALDENSA